MKYPIRNVFTGEVKFTAEIDCIENTSGAVKKRLAAVWGYLNGLDLRVADLSGADLSGVDLSGADLRGVDLYNADLTGAALTRAILAYADLTGANLTRAKLIESHIIESDLSSANLTDADLEGVYLADADLYKSFGDGVFIISIDTEPYKTNYTFDRIQIGCENHSIEEWRNFDDSRIIEMDGKDALRFWRKNKEFIFNQIERRPAKPTNR